MAHMFMPLAIRTPIAHWAQSHSLLILAVIAALVLAALAVSQTQSRWRRLYAASSVCTLASLVSYELFGTI